MVWRSADTAPKRASSSRKVCRSKAAGTRRPSLNRRGSRISYRRYSFISFDALERERYVFPRKRRQGLLWKQQLAALPRLERELAQQEFQGAVLGLFVRKTN